MRIANRSYRRNMVLYTILNSFWTLLFLIAVISIPGNLIITIAEIAIWSLLVLLTARSLWRMPSFIEIDDEHVIFHLLRREVLVRSSEIIEMRYDHKDCKFSVIAMGSNHRFDDISFDDDDLAALRSTISKRGWGHGASLRGRYNRIR